MLRIYDFFMKVCGIPLIGIRADAARWIQFLGELYKNRSGFFGLVRPTPKFQRDGWEAGLEDFTTGLFPGNFSTGFF